jgi:collagen type VII alpha
MGVPGQPGPRGGECEFSAADIAFVLDSSGSITDRDYILLKQFTEGIVDALDISSTTSRVALEIFAAEPEIAAGFSFNKNSIIANVRALRHIQSGTATGAALTLARQSIFSNADALFRGFSVPAFAIVITDGESLEEAGVVAEQARRLREHGVRVFALGIGAEIGTAELLEIAGDSARVFEVADFGVLGASGFVEQFLQSIFCSESPEDGEQGRPGDRGATGPDGRLGVTGPRGQAGRDGTDGANGEDGLPGDQGDRGFNGRDGSDGFDGTNGAKGPRGIDGRDGSTGRTGGSGTPGHKGQRGVDGEDGLPGDAGFTGFTGLQGATGATGRRGPSGSDATDGANGSPGRVSLVTSLS